MAEFWCGSGSRNKDLNATLVIPDNIIPDIFGQLNKKEATNLFSHNCQIKSYERELIVKDETR